MDRDNKQISPTVSVDDTQKEDAIAAAAQIQAQEFSQVTNLQGDAGAVESEGKAYESQSQEPTSASLTVDSGPGFVHVNGDVGGSGHNETLVDVIAVPCAGADPIETWTFSHELCGDVSLPAEPYSGSCTCLRKHSPWVVRDLRMSANIARVFLYKHRALEEGMTLQSLSDDLLDQVEKMREGTVGVPAHSRCQIRYADRSTAGAASLFHRP
jgi:hypothetical protein